MAFDSAQFLRNPIRFDRVDTMMAQVMDATNVAQPLETGRLGGANVVVHTDATADLMDSMEELSMMFEEKSSKKISERKLGETRSRTSAYTEAVENWGKTMSDMPKQDEIEKFIRLLRQMMQNGSPPDVSQLKGMLARLSNDPSHQFAILDILEQALGTEENELRALTNTTREALMKEKGGEIRAGINLASEINARATTPEEMSQLRQLYRSEILGFTTPQDCFRSILASRGAGSLDATIDFLTKGCGTDLTSATPSRDAVALRRILQDLQCVQVLKTVLDTMTGLSNRMGREFGEKMLLNHEAMTGRVIDFTEKSFVSSEQLAAFIAACGVMRLLARMDFARELMMIFRKLSPRLFASEEDRLRLVEASQEHLDTLIAEEVDSDEEDQQ